MITLEQIREMKARNSTALYKELEHREDKGLVSIRMTDGYGIATNYVIENKCPKCGAKFVKIGEHSGCFDGEYTSVDNFTCENECCLSYDDVRKR